MDDEKIKEYFFNDKVISNKANKVFDNFIEDISKNCIKENEETVQDRNNIVDFGKQKSQTVLYNFRKLLSFAASFVIIFVGSNVYAHSKGYDNIFFLLKEVIDSSFEINKNEIFEDKDIIISYQSFNIIDGIEMQVNEIKAKDNNAKLYILVKELNTNEETPLYYKVYNENNKIMFEGNSEKKDGEQYYTEILKLSNYSDNTNSIKLEVYSRERKILKTINIDLDEKTIEARSEVPDIRKISQIELNKFLKKETEKIYKESELKNCEIMVLDIYDIFYSDKKYVVKYLFMKPTFEEFEEEKVEDSDIYLNTAEFELVGEEYKLIKIENPEIF